MSDQSSVVRKRALRQLADEESGVYRELYELVLSLGPGLSRHQARGRARTMLRYQFPGRYLELYALELCTPAAKVPPAVRSRSWQRASARLADLREPDHKGHYARFRAQGMTTRRAWERATAELRNASADLFARLLAEEYRLWLTGAGDAAAGQSCVAAGW